MERARRSERPTFTQTVGGVEEEEEGGNKETYSGPFWFTLVHSWTRFTPPLLSCSLSFSLFTCPPFLPPSLLSFLNSLLGLYVTCEHRSQSVRQSDPLKGQRDEQMDGQIGGQTDEI